MKQLNHLQVRELIEACLDEKKPSDRLKLALNKMLVEMEHPDRLRENDD